MKYKVGDVVELKKPHSEGNCVKILEIVESGPYKGSYKIYIPYWDYFYIDDDDIVGKGEF